MSRGMRGEGVNLPANGEKAVGLPPRAFLYTLDQIGVMLDLSAKYIADQYVYFEGRSIGTKYRKLMVAVNIQQDPEKDPDWRVTEREFIRWMRVKGFRYYERGAFA